MFVANGELQVVVHADNSEDPKQVVAPHHVAQQHSKSTSAFEEHTRVQASEEHDVRFLYCAPCLVRLLCGSVRSAESLVSRCGM